MHRRQHADGGDSKLSGGREQQAEEQQQQEADATQHAKWGVFVTGSADDTVSVWHAVGRHACQLMRGA